MGLEATRVQVINMNMIEVKNLCKEYHVVKKEEGIKGAIKSLFEEVVLK